MWKEAVLKNANKNEDGQVSGQPSSSAPTATAAPNSSGGVGDVVLTPNPEPYDGSGSQGNATPNSNILRAVQGDAGEVPPVEFFANYRSARTDGANSVTSTEFTFKSKQTESSWADDDDDFFESVLSSGKGRGGMTTAPPTKKSGGWKEVKVSGGNGQRGQGGGSRRDSRKAPSGGSGGGNTGGNSKSQASKPIQPESNGRFDALQTWRR